ncbi:Ribosomal large subunit pseudouridine synthase D [Usitatibacter palustris]|uniref:Pseudouridine synthase n=2 Tax=Usitatibacter palustris TaxID=2732487 RepID=A0A6M4H776_9PROT|nr:Ribosomal large subunit pseudouridine synthase D [Usitatibacter palustris]
MVNPASGSRNYNPPEPPARRVNLTIPLDLAGLRLDQALAKLLPEVSRSRLAKLIEDGHVLVDGESAAVRTKVRSGEKVEVALVPRPEEAAFRPEAIALPIVHEDDHVLVIDKPAGLVVHPGTGNWAGTMLNALLHHAPGLKHLPRAGIVHRLDKETSGLLVVAKDEATQLDLVRQLQERTVKRTYVALARGRIAAGGTVDKPIGRHPTKRTRMAVVANGKEAVTHYRVKEAFAAHTLLECDLETGRTHQIRVHLAAIGHPLEGDPEYGGKGERIFQRQALHAWKLAFKHPSTGKLVKFESPMPEDFLALLTGLRKV